MPRPYAIAAVAALSALTPLAGCGDDQYKQSAARIALYSSVQPRSTVAPPAPGSTVSPGERIVFGPGGPPDLAKQLGQRSIPGATGSVGQNLAEKGQTFSQLVYAYNGFTDGRIGADTIRALDAGKKAAGSLGTDENVDSIRQLADTLLRAVEANAMDDALLAHRVAPTRVRWADGAIAVQEQLTSMLQRPSVISGTTPQQLLRASDRDLIETAGRWATSHHETPAMTRQRALAEAGDAVERLYDSLNRERKTAGAFAISRKGWNLRPNPGNDSFRDTDLNAAAQNQ
jgi:hypothetical protein